MSWQYFTKYENKTLNPKFLIFWQAARNSSTISIHEQLYHYIIQQLIYLDTVIVLLKKSPVVLTVQQINGLKE